MAARCLRPRLAPQSGRPGQASQEENVGSETPSQPASQQPRHALPVVLNNLNLYIHCFLSVVVRT